MGSLYQRIHDDLEEKIMSGVWSPGQRIPFEHELTEQYSCSRMTVNKAISALVSRGMIVRRQKAGSFVAAPQIDRTVMDIQDIGAEARNAGKDYAFKILDRALDRLTPTEALRLGEPEGSEVVRLQCLHFLDGLPNALERRVILLAAVPAVRDEMFTVKSPGAWLLDQVPWSEARHVIRAIPADATVARLLQISRRDACLNLSRQTWQNGRTVTYVDIAHPGDRYQFAGTFQPSFG